MPRRPRDEAGLVIVPPAVEARAELPVVATRPGEFDLQVYRGDTMEWVFHLLAGSGFVAPPGGAPESTQPGPIDITGWRFKAEIRSGIDGTLWGSLQRMPSVDPFLDTRDPDGAWALAEELRNGWLRMRLTPDQSRLIKGSGVWDLEGTTPDGWVKTLLLGGVELAGDVTTGTVYYDKGRY